MAFNNGGRGIFNVVRHNETYLEAYKVNAFFKAIIDQYMIAADTTDIDPANALVEMIYRYTKSMDDISAAINNAGLAVSQRQYIGDSFRIDNPWPLNFVFEKLTPDEEDLDQMFPQEPVDEPQPEMVETPEEGVPIDVEYEPVDVIVEKEPIEEGRDIEA